MPLQLAPTTRSRTLGRMRRYALFICLLAGCNLALSPLASVHAHIYPHGDTVVHGGHGHHDFAHRHAHDENRSRHSHSHAADLISHAPDHLIVQHSAQFAHDHSIDGHIVHCDVVAVQLDTVPKIKYAFGRARAYEPLADERSVYKPPQRERALLTRRFYLHPPLRGPPPLP